MQTRLGNQVSVSALFPPRFPQFRHPEILQVGVVVVGVEAEIRCDADSHRTGSKLDKAGEIGRRQLFPSLSPSAREIDAVKRERARLDSSNEDRLAVRAPGNERISGLGPYKRVGAG